MVQTPEGAKKNAANLKKKFGPDYYKKLGKKGGKVRPRKFRTK